MNIESHGSKFGETSETDSLLFKRFVLQKEEGLLNEYDLDVDGDMVKDKLENEMTLATAAFCSDGGCIVTGSCSCKCQTKDCDLKIVVEF